MIGLWIGLATVALLALVVPTKLRMVVRHARDDHRRRPALWNRFYAHDWGETTTNNYGFAPAKGDHPQRFQHQMYQEMLRLLQAADPLGSRRKMLEVSCGRGGGLNAFLAAAPGKFDATGLDIAQTAIDFCRRTYCEVDNRRFVTGSALDLPFADGSFDIVLNVEASNDYGDRRRFFAEVARVLRPNGIFLYADTFRPGRTDTMLTDLVTAGFEADFRDITANVAEACRLDTPRRRAVIGERAPLIGRLFFRRELENYAAIEGSRKYRAFCAGERSYLMTAAVKG